MVQPVIPRQPYSNMSPTNFGTNWHRMSGHAQHNVSMPSVPSTPLPSVAPSFVPQRQLGGPVLPHHNSQPFYAGYHPRAPQQYYGMFQPVELIPRQPYHNISPTNFGTNWPRISGHAQYNVSMPSVASTPLPSVAQSFVPQTQPGGPVLPYHNSPPFNAGCHPRASQQYAPTGGVHQSTDSENNLYIEDVIVFGDKLIGNGAFGSVLKGEFRGMQCAVKVLTAVATELVTRSRLNTASENFIQQNVLEKFKRECEYLQNIQHKNIVRHLATRTYKNIPVLVMELLNCNLRVYLHDIVLKEAEIKLLVQLSISVDVASGLEFLHHDERKIVHRDLCGDNILLSTESNFPVAKIADFGMSRIIDFERMSRSLSAMGHRNGYLPPEASRLTPEQSYDSSLDIFMFGAVMTQIARKISHIQDEKERQKLVMSINKDHPLQDIIVQCLDVNRCARPTAKHIRPLLYERLMRHMK